ncbi:hypothetical protein PSHT_04704 [Puccinia striiformis]|uniref:glucan 1,3-beta-glucosidase n=1 Tax=Puccinia striiformis TaxID=27350 RepID=A0A2S4WCG7_9BASI|nr:hypothetical protein PSHT_04704 [Puccinia striiformis]
MTAAADREEDMPSSPLPAPPRLVTASSPVDPYLHDSYPPRRASLSPSPEPEELHHIPDSRPHSPYLPPLPNNPFAYDPPSDSMNPLASHDSVTVMLPGTRQAIVNSLESEPNLGYTLPVVLDKLEETEIEGVGLVHPTTSKRVPPDQDSFYVRSNQPIKKSRRRKVIITLLGLALVIVIIIIGTVLSLRKSRLADLGKLNPNDGTVVTASGDIIKLGLIMEGHGFRSHLMIQPNPKRFTPIKPTLGLLKQAHFGSELGGWLVLEPFITPYMFEPFSSHDENGQPPTVVDEWTLSVALGDKLASTLEEHYRTFITEEDFMQIAAAGLNWIRLPVGWWMIETWDGEPFLKGVSFKYFLKALQWARKYGLRVNLDLHAVPGSQNGFNHSGKLGSINFLVGLMGVANAQRTLNYIRTLTQFISQPQYVNVVPMFSVLNEALVQKIGVQQMRSFLLMHTPLSFSYLQVYQMMRGITGYGVGKGPMMIIHDGFQGTGAGHTGWGGYLKGADRIGLDTHTYFAFDKQSNDSLDTTLTNHARFNQTNTDFGFNFAGEYSLAVNDCGLWLNNVGVGSRYDGTYPTATSPDTVHFPMIGSCDPWKDYRTWTPDMKKSIADLAATSQDAMQNSFFWTWKISRSIRTPELKPNPMWDYQLGLQQGWIRPDARGVLEHVLPLPLNREERYPSKHGLANLRIGKSVGSTHTIRTMATTTNFHPTRPRSDVSRCEQPTPIRANGTPVILKPGPPDPHDSPITSPISPGSGWANDNDRAGWFVPVKGCQYPNPWEAGGLPAPTTPFCTGTPTLQPSSTA